MSLLTSATELSRLYAARQLSPVEVCEAAIARIETLNPRLNAFYAVTADQALEQARASEKRWQSGSPNGPFDGVPTSIKDALSAVDTLSYRGSAAHVSGGVKANQDAPAVARLREQGCVFLGKTTMPDFGILASGYSSKHGITRNPWDETKNPGGSSAGAAATIAAGINPIAIGTDIVGSIRLPASFCGLVGHKPSQGRVPYYFPNAATLVAGPMARTVTDVAQMLDILAQEDARDFTALAAPAQSFLHDLERPPARCRVGLMQDIGFGPRPDSEVVQSVAEAAKIIGAEGYEIVPIESPFGRDDDAAGELFYKSRCYAEFAKFPPEVRQQADIINRWTAPITDTSARELFDATNTLQQQRETVMRWFDDIEFLFLPSVAISPFAAELAAPDPQALFAPWSNNFLFNLTEQPASSINCGYTADGLPVGLQIVGKRRDDAGVLRMARLYERLQSEQRAWPLD